MYLVTAGSARTPVNSPPVSPAIPCAGNTPSASSNFSLGASLFNEIHGIVPAAIPIIRAPYPLTYPAAGVIATSPVTHAVVAPTSGGLLMNFMSINIQAITLEAAASSVFRTAIAESIELAYGSPPLNPFHPSQRIPAPINTRVKLFGLRRLSETTRGPTARAAARAVIPADRCITYPPAQSTAPTWFSQPPAESQYANGLYTRKDQRGTNT